MAENPRESQMVAIILGLVAENRCNRIQLSRELAIALIIQQIRPIQVEVSTTIDPRDSCHTLGFSAATSLRIDFFFSFFFYFNFFFLPDRKGNCRCRKRTRIDYRRFNSVRISENPAAWQRMTANFSRLKSRLFVGNESKINK